MRNKCEADVITLKEAPIYNPESIGTVERYHGPLRSAYMRIVADLPRENINDEFLRIKVHEVNNTIGP